MKKIEQLIDVLSKKCKEKHFSIVTAESCTGGGLAYFITKNPNCSSVLERGYVVYSMNAKEEMLNVAPNILQTFGLASKEVAKELAEKALEKSKAQISIAITGFDETAVIEAASDKIGIVWIACMGINKKLLIRKFEIKGNRKKFCEEVILECVNMLIEFIT